MKDLIPIGKMAAANRVTIATLRLYDQMGLLKPAYTDPDSGYRYYDIKQTSRLDFIRYMRELDLSLAAVMCESIKDALTALDKEGAQFYGDNCAALVKQLSDLDGRFEELFKAHPGAVLCFGGQFAYSHFIRHYGVKYLSAYDSCSEEDEPSLGQVIRVIDGMKQSGSKAVFTDEHSNGDVAKQIAAETIREKALYFRRLCAKYGWEIPAHNPANAVTGFFVHKNADILCDELQKHGIFIMPSGKPHFFRVSHMGSDTYQDLDDLAGLISEIENLPR